jgi:23S rRNA pseudouridine1911/1915/1917 synthase
MTVVYEDNHIIVVNKTSSEIVQGDKTGDIPLSETVKQYLKEKYQKPGNVFVGVAHRLDRPVSGLVVFAKTSKALSRLNEMFKNSEVKKTYWAIVKELLVLAKTTRPLTGRSRRWATPTKTLPGF